MSGLNRRRPEPAMGGFSDSDANILASLAHEACESHCSECDGCLMGEESDELCEDCEADWEPARPPAWMMLEPWQDLVARVSPDHTFSYPHDIPAPKGNQ